MPTEERVGDPKKEQVLLIATVEELVRHEIAFREAGEVGAEARLVFPSQLTRENPELPEPPGRTLVFGFEGPVLHIYSTLVVRLSYNGMFVAKELWRNAVEFRTQSGEICGLFLRERREGEAELGLFFSGTTASATRARFEEYVQVHLQQRASPGSLRCWAAFVCQDCGGSLTDRQVAARRERGFVHADCPICDSRIELNERERSVEALDAIGIPEMDRTADARREEEVASFVVEGKRAIGEFDVFLCHNSEDKPEVRKIGVQLKKLGLLPWLDEWELRPGFSWQESLQRELSRIHSAAVFVGKGGIGPWQKKELEALLSEFVRRDVPVIPVLLRDAPAIPSLLPLFMRQLTWVDFREADPDPLGRLVWGVTGKRMRSSKDGNGEAGEATRIEVAEARAIVDAVSVRARAESESERDEM
jgi:hypothetical protein